MSTVLIRRPGPPDLERLAEVHAAIFPGDGWEEAFWAEALARDADRLLLAEDEGPVGLFAARAAAGDADILTFGVVPPRRGEGIGVALLKAGLADLAEAGTSRVILEVRADNDAALALYRKAGFIHQGNRPDYYGRGVPALVLICDLARGSV